MTVSLRKKKRVELNSWTKALLAIVFLGVLVVVGLNLPDITQKGGFTSPEGNFFAPSQLEEALTNPDVVYTLPTEVAQARYTNLGNGECFIIVSAYPGQEINYKLDGGAWSDLVTTVYSGEVGAKINGCDGVQMIRIALSDGGELRIYEYPLGG